MHIRSLLFVGRRNAARSVMAEACFNSAAILGWRAFSAGWNPEDSVDDAALLALARHGFATDDLYSKPVGIFLQTAAPEVDLCVFLDDRPPEDAANYPGDKEYWHIPDPQAHHDPAAGYDEVLGVVTARVSSLILSGRLVEAAERLRAAS